MNEVIAGKTKGELVRLLKQLSALVCSGCVESGRCDRQFVDSFNCEKQRLIQEILEQL